MREKYLPDPKWRKLGLHFNTEGKAAYWLWAPNAANASLDTDRKSFRLKPAENGYWYGRDLDISADESYAITLCLHDGTKLCRADPASLAIGYNCGATHSIALNPLSYTWNDEQWKGIPLEAFIIYELHVGTFTTEGTFDAILSKLDYLKDLGITAIELMPVAQFPGNRNWGYDGVYPFAVQDSYGGARGLQRLVDGCHAKGLGVILDVVYNHFGPEDNFFCDFGPYFTDAYQTPWGQAVNFDDRGADGVRDFFIENALMWFRDFHIDGLRLDAVHAIKDFSAVHFLEALRSSRDELSAITGKHHFLLVELDLNDNRYINPPVKGGYGMDAQWIDEFHHALRVSAGQERMGYYADFSGVGDLAKAFNNAYVYDGQYSSVRRRRFGRPATGNPASQFIVFSQNHDQVGNRMKGERSSQLLGASLLRVMAGAVILGPFLPLLFMGEEYAEDNPFPFFVSFRDAELIESVRKGRRSEFKDFDDTDMPDPQDPGTFYTAKLSWEKLRRPHHAKMLKYYQELIRLRKASPILNSRIATCCAIPIGENQGIQLKRETMKGSLFVLMNFSTAGISVELEGTGANLLLDSTLATWGGESRQPLSLKSKNIVLPPESIIVIAYESI